MKFSPCQTIIQQRIKAKKAVLIEIVRQNIRYSRNFGVVSSLIIHAGPFVCFCVLLVINVTKFCRTLRELVTAAKSLLTYQDLTVLGVEVVESTLHQLYLTLLCALIKRVKEVRKGVVELKVSCPQFSCSNCLCSDFFIC